MFLFRSGISGIGMIHSDKHWYHSHLNGILKWFKQISADDFFTPKFCHFLSLEQFLPYFPICTYVAFSLTFILKICIEDQSTVLLSSSKNLNERFFNFRPGLKKLTIGDNQQFCTEFSIKKHFPNWLNKKRRPWKFWRKVLVYFWRPEGWTKNRKSNWIIV